jgi:hypothetical protein
MQKLQPSSALEASGHRVVKGSAIGSTECSVIGTGKTPALGSGGSMALEAGDRSMVGTEESLVLGTGESSALGAEGNSVLGLGYSSCKDPTVLHFEQDAADVSEMNFVALEEAKTNIDEYAYQFHTRSAVTFFASNLLKWFILW